MNYQEIHTKQLNQFKKIAEIANITMTTNAFDTLNDALNKLQSDNYNNIWNKHMEHLIKKIL